MLSSRQRRQLLGLALLALAVFTSLSLVPVAALGETGARWFPQGNIMGVAGRAFASAGVGGLGVGAVALPALLGVGGAYWFGWMRAPLVLRWAAFLSGALVLVPAFAALWTPGLGPRRASPVTDAAAGWVGRTVAVPFVALLGWLGALLALTVALIALSIATLGWNPAGTLGVAAGRAGAALRGWIGEWRSLRERRADRAPAPAVVAGVAEPQPAVEAVAESGESAASNGAAAVVERAALRVLGRSRRRKTSARPVLEDVGDPESGDLPPLPLLSQPPDDAALLSEGELDRLGDVLIRTLKTFKVEGEIGGRTTGPVVTQFEVVPAPGVKVNRIAALDADLALALKAPSIRIVAPIPGKGAVGVEVPNPEPEVVYLRRILESPAFQRSRGQLPVALGKDLTGKAYVADLGRMPHLLIAGTTGSGKSICVNTLITSLIYRHSPRTLRLLMIDPKMVELSMYGDLPHLRHPVVTDPQDAATVLKWAVLEMERRYTLLSENGARSLTEFNRRAEEGQPMRRAEPVGADDDPDRWVYSEGPLPFIVAVVDELADLMMTVQAEIEKPLAQLAQKARAIGIHLIVATQRPSVNVITGLIKANFPCRIAFRVSSKVDSRTILDQNGADALLGNGDMLFLPPGHSDPVRIQGAFIPTEDTERLMAWYRERAERRPAGEDDILDVVRSMEAEDAADVGLAAFEERDALFRQAAELCLQFQQGSTSLLQRRLRIGYGRAARIIDQLHHAGVLGPPDGSKPREVLVGMESLEAICEEGGG